MNHRAERLTSSNPPLSAPLARDKTRSPEQHSQADIVRASMSGPQPIQTYLLKHQKEVGELEA